MDSKNIKIKAVFFILFFLWILMAQGKQGADSLGLWRKAGWNWPLCRPQATGLCTTFSGLKYCCKFNFHPLKEDRGLQKQQKPAFLARESSSAHSSLLSLEVPVQCWAEAADTGNVWKFHLPWGRWLCPDHCSPVFGKKTSQHKAWDVLSMRRHLTHLQSLVLVELPWRYGLEKLLQHKRLCHSLERERIWFLRVCSNRLKASAHYFSCFPEFQRNFKTLPESWGFYLEC